MNPFSQCLHDSNVESIANIRKDLVSVHTTTNISDAIEVMAKQKLISVPVVEPGSNTCYGVVDLLDIIQYILSAAPNPETIQAHQLRSLEINGKAMSWGDVRKAIESSGKDRFTPIYPESDVFKMVSIFSNGIHDFPIVDHNDNLVGLVTQHAMIRHFNKCLNTEQFKYIGDKSIEYLEMNKGQVIVSVKDTYSVLFALYGMKRKQVSALAVVDKNGKLVGNFSVSDLRGLLQEEFPNFLLRVDEFLKKFHPQSMNPLFCKLSDSLKSVVHKLSQRHVHRLWIVDDDLTPVGVVSITDIMKLLVEIRVKRK